VKLKDEDLDRGVAAAVESMAFELAAIGQLEGRVRSSLRSAIELLSSARGRVIVSGIGKSGHIASKISATFSSTGTPAQFIHSTEALHGDSGAAVPGDVAILISNSGETAEVCQFAQMLKLSGIPVIAMAGNADSTLARLSDVFLSIQVDREADPLNLAPTSSTAVTLVLGDSLAAALMVLTRFDADDFALRHPGGSLGIKLASLPEGGNRE